jgi:hypothetical protein
MMSPTFLQQTYSKNISKLLEMIFLTLMLLSLPSLNVIMVYIAYQNIHQAKKMTPGAYLWGASLSAWIVTCGVGVVNSTFHHEHAILAFLFLGLHLSLTRLIEKNTFAN